MNGRRLRLAALVVMAGVSASGGAETPLPGYDEVSARVEYGDLDLATPAGRKAFRKRVEGQVARMCTIGDPTEPLVGPIRRECIELSRPSVDRQVKLALERSMRVNGQALASRE